MYRHTVRTRCGAQACAAQRRPGTVSLVARDAERQRTYDAETMAFADTTLSDLRPLADLVAVTCQVTSSRFWACEAAGRPVTVTATRSDSTVSWARPLDGIVKLAPVGMTLATLAHELAHVAAGAADVGHSPRFRALEIAVVRLLVGDEPADRLTEAFRSARLSIDDIGDAGDEAGPGGLVDPAARISGDVRLARAATIRKLLDRAAATSAPAEAASCEAKAAELMARYRVDDLLLASLAGDADSAAQIVERKIHVGTGPYVRARIRLVEACASSHGCTVFWRTGGHYNTVYVVGHGDDVAAAMTVHTLLANHAAVSMRAARPSGNTLSWRRAFLLGYAAAAHDRLQQATAAAVTAVDSSSCADSSVALVLTARAERLDSYMASEHKNLQRVRTAPAQIAAAHAAGRRAARTADLHVRRRLPTAPRALGPGD
jgi:hypothetical protein